MADLIRNAHPYAFRSGQWAELRTIAPSTDRDCYVVEFPDGVTDYWVVGDPAARYEFAITCEPPDAWDRFAATVEAVRQSGQYDR